MDKLSHLLISHTSKYLKHCIFALSHFFGESVYTSTQTYNICAHTHMHNLAQARIYTHSQYITCKGLPMCKHVYASMHSELALPGAVENYNSTVKFATGAKISTIEWARWY